MAPARDDLDVLDEPLYANFLCVTGVDRPYQQELLSKMFRYLSISSAGPRIPDGNKVIKEHVAKQRLPNLTSDLMKKGKHFILIHKPMNILAVFSGLCEDLGIPFQPQMLKWKAGPRDFDGIWAPWWYESVHTSTDFSKSRRYPMVSLDQTSLLISSNLLQRDFTTFLNLLRQVRRTAGSLLPPPPDPPLPVPENKKILVCLGDELLPRDSARVSVFDSVVQGGDAVWEGLRIYDGKVFKLEDHMDRLFDSTKTMAFSNVPSRDWIQDAIFKTLNANGMFSNAHDSARVTSGMSPAFNLYGRVLIVLGEWKPLVYDNSHGIKLVTATTHRNSPNSVDSKIHHTNLINNILAKIEGNLAQAEDAIMLDQDGFVSETNATNIFMVRKGIVLTPHADYCLLGITHATVNLFIFHIEIIGANLQNTWIDCLILQKLWPSAMCPVVIGIATKNHVAAEGSL
ncbi:branched-chain-amino-acid aminotransferase-like protein 1 [Triticum aestivum]|uniref:branched-chain-amino-acid aminotransferase-like protein 1 n=1 Tax=Triticum aestivum TaxID=4565 RepID=UPI001D0234B3|nr:branched-chain-amino-acid aminotransferase-like protein 1 [Triticum aestivum]